MTILENAEDDVDGSSYKRSYSSKMNRRRSPSYEKQEQFLSITKTSIGQDIGK